MAIGADGAIVVVGTHAVFNGRAANFAVARYTSGGALDRGRGRTDFGRSQSTYDSGEGVAIQADGRIVVVGYGAEQTQFGGYFTRDLQLARYETSGALDSSFSDDGRLETSFYADTLGYGVALDGNGRVVAFAKAGGAFGLARLNTDGTLDATFSDNGKQTADAALAGGDDGRCRRRRAGRRQAGGRRDHGRRRLRARALSRRPAGSQPAGSEHTANADHRRSVRADERDFAVVQVHGDARRARRSSASSTGRAPRRARTRAARRRRRTARSRTAGTRSRFARHAPGSPTRPRRRGRSPSIRWRRR